MIVSGSSSTPSPLGECVVCGKESSTRCSKCSQGGVNWMYFCSREHQKLVWPVHSRVCGEAFKWPSLKPKEREEMLEFTTKPTKEEDSSNTTTWAKDFESQMKGNISHLGHTERCNCLKEALQRSIKTVSTNQALLFDLRLSAFNVRIGLKALESDRLNIGHFGELLIADPFGCLAFSQSCQMEDWTKHFDASWYSEFQHLSVVLVALIGELHRDLRTNRRGVNRPEPTVLDHTLNKMRAIARSEISPLNPSLAKTILEGWLPKILEDVGIKMTSEG